MDILIKPMEPVSCKEPFDSSDFIYELKWDGIRIVAFSDGNKVRLQNRNLKDRTNKFPELHALANSIKAREVILDGEVVVLWEGKPNFHKVMERAMASSDQSIGGMVRSVPVIYVVFDILYHNGQWLQELPLIERKELLSEIIVKGPNLQTSDSLEGNGIDIFQAVCEGELEGIVAKVKDSKYLMGKKDKRWLKIKRRIEQKCVILGFYSAGDFVTSLITGAYHNGHLIYVGRVASGLSDSKARELYGILVSQIISSQDKNLSKKHKGAKWVKPVYAAEVEFMEWTEDWKMRAPVLRKFLGVTDPRECEIY